MVIVNWPLIALLMSLIEHAQVCKHVYTGSPACMYKRVEVHWEPCLYVPVGEAPVK